MKNNDSLKMDTDFYKQLFKKRTDAMILGKQLGINTNAEVKEAERQMAQLRRGEKATKSGPED